MTAPFKVYLKSMRFLVLLVFLCVGHLSQASQLCQNYFGERDKDVFVQELLVKSQNNNNPDFWIETIRYISENNYSFPFADKVRFGTYYKFEGFKNPSYKRHMLAGLVWRGSHVDLPKVAPQNKKELAEFLVHFAYSLEQQLANRNTFSFPLEASFSYLKSRHTLETRLHKRLDKVESLIESSATPTLAKPFLKLYLVYNKTKSFLKIQWFETELRSRFGSMLPWHYVKDVNFILKSYDTDIKKLISKIQMLTNHEVLLSDKTVPEKNWMIHFVNGVVQTVIRPFLPPFAPVTFWEPLNGRHPKQTLTPERNWKQPSTWMKSSSVAAAFKYFSDGTVITMRASAILLAATILQQSVMEVYFIRQFEEALMKRHPVPEQILEKPSPSEIEMNYRDHIEMLEQDLAEQKQILEKTQNETEKTRLLGEIQEREESILQAKTNLKAWILSQSVNAH